MSRHAVAIYTPLARLAIPSGVPRHIREVVTRLLSDSTLDVSFFVNSAEASKYLPPLGEMWSSAPRTVFSQSTALLHRSWGILDFPSFEDYGGRADWVYLPADGYLPTRSAKLAITIHDLYQLDFREGIPNLRVFPVYARAALRADVVFTVSRFSADRIMQILRIPAKRIEIVYNGIDQQFFEPPQEKWDALNRILDVGGDDFFLVSGGLKPKKNSAVILEAWRRFSRTHPYSWLLVTGHSDPQVVRDAQASVPRLRFLPTLSDAELALAMSRAKALLFPSRYEGFGLPALEAFAAGTLVIASDIPTFRELLGDAPLYVNPKSPTSLANSMRQVTLGLDERDERIRSGRAAARRFSWDNVAAAVRSRFI